MPRAGIQNAAAWTARRFYGGRYGILTEKPSPAWQFTLIDSTFEGQRKAAISEHEAGLTLDPEGTAYLVNPTTNVVMEYSHAVLAAGSAVNPVHVRVLNLPVTPTGAFGMTVGP